MPNVTYASDNTQPTTRTFMPGSDQIFTVDLSSGTLTYQAGVFDTSQPSNLSAPGASAASSRVVIAGIGEVEAITSIGSFFRNVVKGAEKVGKMAWKWAGNAVNTVIQTAENIYTLTITSLEDAVTAVVGFLKTVIDDIKKVIEWLSALFDFEAIIANHNTIKSYITNAQQTGVFDQMQAWIKNEINVLGTVESDITNVFNNNLKGQGQSNMQTTGGKVAGQTVQSQQGSNSNVNDAYNTGGNNNATQSKWLHHKTMENSSVSGCSGGVGARPPVGGGPSAYKAYLPWVSHGGGGGAAQPRSALAVSDGPDADALLQAFLNFFESVGETIANDFANFPAQLQAAMETLKDKFKDPKSVLANAFTDVLAVLAVLADDMLALGIEIAAAFLQLCDTVLAQVMLLATETVTIPFVTDLYKLLTGNDMTLLDLIALIAAVPTTILMEVLTGGKTPSALAQAQAQRQPLRGAIDEVGQIFLGIFQFAVNAIGAVIDALSFNLNGTEGVSGAKQNLISRIDAVKGLFSWALGMVVSQAWNTWGGFDYVYWLIQAWPVFYNLFTLFYPYPMIEVVDLDTLTGIMFLVSSAVYAAIWPGSYLDAPKAPVLTLFVNLFNSFGYLIEIVYYAQAALSNELAAAAGAAGKLLLEEVNAILGLVAYGLTVAHPTSTSTATGVGAQPALLSAAPPPTPTSSDAPTPQAPAGSVRQSLSFA